MFGTFMAVGYPYVYRYNTDTPLVKSDNLITVYMNPSTFVEWTGGKPRGQTNYTPIMSRDKGGFLCVSGENARCSVETPECLLIRLI